MIKFGVWNSEFGIDNIQHYVLMIYKAFALI